MRKMFNEREKAALRLASMRRNDGRLIAEVLEPRMKRVLDDGEEMPDLAHLLDVLGRVVQAECQDLDDADMVRIGEGEMSGGNSDSSDFRDKVSAVTSAADPLREKMSGGSTDGGDLRERVSLTPPQSVLVSEGMDFFEPVSASEPEGMDFLRFHVASRPEARGFSRGRDAPRPEETGFFRV